MNIEILTSRGYATIIGFISSPSAIPFVDGWIPSLEETEWLVEHSEKFRELIKEKGSITTSTIVDGWIKTIEVNHDFDATDDCTLYNSEFVREQSMVEDREGYCTIPIFKLNTEIKSAIIYYVHDAFGDRYKFVNVCEVGEEQENIKYTTRHNTEIEEWEIVKCYIENNK